MIFATFSSNKNECYTESVQLRKDTNKEIYDRSVCSARNHPDVKARREL